MARHRSPSGAPAGHPGELTTPLRAVGTTPGVHRLPAPPAASMRNRITVAAVATGAVVAGGQTLVAPFLPAQDLPPVTLSALAPVAEVQHVATVPETELAIGGDQLLPADVLNLVQMDPASQVDVGNLVRAVEMGEELARRSTILDTALSWGAPQASVVGDTVYVQPTTGRFTSGFGGRWGRSHNGIDLAAPIGTPIYAVTDGVIEESGPASGFGMWVVLRHDDGYRSVYGHVNQSFVSIGQRVEAGEEIAEVGNRGFSTGPHLHFEVYTPDDTPINPRTWLQQRDVFGW